MVRSTGVCVLSCSTGLWSRDTIMLVRLAFVKFMWRYLTRRNAVEKVKCGVNARPHKKNEAATGVSRAQSLITLMTQIKKINDLKLAKEIIIYYFVCFCRHMWKNVLIFDKNILVVCNVERNRFIYVYSRVIGLCTHKQRFCRICNLIKPFPHHHLTNNIIIGYFCSTYERRFRLQRTGPSAS